MVRPRHRTRPTDPAQHRQILKQTAPLDSIFPESRGAILMLRGSQSGALPTPMPDGRAARTRPE
nr:MAG TPA: hypothetical protein [Caudoviricetes sp.]